MGVKLSFFSLLFDFRHLTGYERKEFKANSCEKKACKRYSAVDDAVDYFCYLHEAQSSPRRAEIETEMRRAGDTVSVLQGRSVERGGNMRSERKPFKDL